MKIILDCERMKYPHTGLFEYCQQLGNALKALKEPKDELGFYLNPTLRHHFNENDFFVDQHGLQKFLFPRLKNIDLWHTTYQLSRYVPQSSKIKRVLTVHDLNFLYEGKSAAKVKKYLQKHQENIDRCDHIVAISEFTRQDIIKHLRIGDKPISVIYNGCAPPLLLPEATPAYLPLKPFLFALGTVNPKKNFHVLVALLYNNDFELVISGKTEPDYVQKILNEARKHGVEKRVKITGPVTDTEKCWYYQHCEAFLFPSLAEGFGIPPIEAMTFGKPVFLSDKTSLPEIGGDCAYYFHTFDPVDMQHTFVAGMDHYHQFQPAERIRQHAGQFNWSNSAKAYWETYKNTLNG